MPVQNLLLPVHPHSLFHRCSQAGICESFVCWLGTELKPFGSQWRSSLSESTETGRIIARVSSSLCSVICNGLTLKPCLAGMMATIKFNQSSAAFALYTAVDLSVAYALAVVDCVLFGDELGSDAGLVAVEGRDMKHVAVCADPDRLHLAISRQRSRMGRAARAEDLKWHNMLRISHYPPMMAIHNVTH